MLRPETPGDNARAHRAACRQRLEAEQTGGKDRLSAPEVSRAARPRLGSARAHDLS